MNNTFHLSVRPCYRCDQLVKRILSYYDVTKSDEERRKDFEECDNFMKLPKVKTECVRLLLSNESHYVRYFALLLLSYRIKNKWDHITLMECTDIENIVVTLMENSSSVLIGEQVDLTGGLVKLMIEMICKSNWSRLNPSNLLLIASNGDYPLKIILNFYLQLLSIYNDSREELLSDKSTKIVTEYLKSKCVLELLCGTIHRNNNNNIHDGKVVTDEIKLLCLNVLREFIEFVIKALSFRSLLEHADVLFDAFRATITDPMFFSIVVDSVTVIVKTAMKPDDIQSIVSRLFVSDGLLKQCQQADVSQCDALELSELLLEISELLNRLTRRRVTGAAVTSVYPFKTQSESDNFVIYMELSMQVCRRYETSYHVALNTIASLKNLKTEFTTSYYPTIIGYILPLLKVCDVRLLEIPYVLPTMPNLDTNLGRAWKCVHREFTNAMDYKAFHSKVRTALSAVLKFDKMMLFLYFLELLDGCVDNVSVSLEREDLDWECLRWEHMYRLSAVMNTMPPDGDYNGTTANIARKWMGLLSADLIDRVTNPVILRHFINSIEFLIRFSYKRCYLDVETSNYLKDVITKRLFDCLFFQFPNATSSSTAEISIDVIRLRECTGNLLLQLCVEYPELMIPFFELVYAKYQQVPRGMEAVPLLHSVILLSSRCCEDVQRVCLDGVIMNVFNYWNPMESSLLLNSQKFLNYLGNDVSIMSVEEARENRRNFLSIIDTISVTVFCAYYTSPQCFRFIESIDQMILPLLELIGKLMRLLNSLWSRDMCQYLSSVYDDDDGFLGIARYKVDVGRLDARYDKLAYFYLEDDSSKFSSADFLSVLYEKIVCVMSTVYELLMNFEQPGVAAASSVVEISSFVNLTENLFHNIDCLPDYQLTLLLRKAGRCLILSCPFDKHDSILLPFVKMLSLHMRKRLRIRWRHLLNDKSGLDTDIILDLIKEYTQLLKLALTMSYHDTTEWRNNRCFFKTIEEIIDCLTKISIVKDGGDKSYEISNTGCKILQDEDVADAVLDLLMKRMHVMQTDESSVKLYIALIQHTRQRIDQPLAVKTFKSLLAALKITGYDIGTSSHILWAILTVYSLLRPTFLVLFDALSAIVPPNDFVQLRHFDEQLQLAVPGWPEKMKKRKLYDLLGSFVKDSSSSYDKIAECLYEDISFRTSAPPVI